MNDKTTDLRNILLVGPRLASLADQEDSDEFAWKALVATAYQGKDRKDKSLVNSTHGIRVVLQDTVTEPIDIDVDREHGGPLKAEDINLHVPRLLAANLHARQFYGRHHKLITSTLVFPGADKDYDLRAPVPEEDPEKGEQTRGFFTVAVTPIDHWPSTQKNLEISVPRFALAEHRMRILVNAKGGTLTNPFGFLRFATIPNDEKWVAAFVPKPPSGVTSPRHLPRIELPVVKASGPDATFVALELTPHGLEMHGTVANPIRAFEPTVGPERLEVVLRLVHTVDPLEPNKTRWSLELVREENKDAPNNKGHMIRDALSKVRDGFRPEGGKPIFLDIDTDAGVLAVRWPLELRDGKSLSLKYERQEDWRLWVDIGAVDSLLIGAPVRGGELPTNLKLLPDRLQIDAKQQDVYVTLDADRRDPADKSLDRYNITGPYVEIKWTTSTRSSEIAIENDGAKKISWFFDQDELARDLVARYKKAGVHPPHADTTYAFLPISGGWLQLPFDLCDSAPVDMSDVDAKKSGLNSTERNAVPFAGSFETTIPPFKDKDGQIEGPIGRRLSLSAADHVRAEAKFVAGNLETITVNFRGSAGTVDGILWMATGSPTPEDILPSLAAGPVSLTGPTLQFRRPTDETSKLGKIESSDFKPGQDFKLTLPALGAKARSKMAYLWQGYSELPLITAVPITRTALGSGLPSESRGLLCREINREDIAITLTHTTENSAPTLGLLKGETKQTPQEPQECPLLASSTLEKIPLVAVTLAGIEIKPGKGAFSNLPVSLSYGLPILDEYFANVRLPETGPTAPPSNKATPGPSPVDSPTSLDIPALQKAWGQAVDRLNLSRVQAAYAFEVKAQKVDSIQIEHLFGRTTWTTSFQLKPSAMIDGKQYSFGSYILSGENYSGEKALQGLSKPFKIEGNTLKAQDNLTKESLSVVGFAAAAWKDTASDMWRDSRGALSAEMPKTVPFHGDQNGLVLRKTKIIGQKEQATYWYWLATAATPIKVISPPGNDGRKLAIWFRDLPLKEEHQGERRFAPGPEDVELAIGPLQSAFDAERLPLSLYEWRFCNDPFSDNAGQSLYDIAIGPFRFRPLRLSELTLREVSGNWAVEGVTIIGSITPPGESTSTKGKGPFGPEPYYRTGNLVAISLKKMESHDLTFEKADWQNVSVSATSIAIDGAAELSFRYSNVSVCLGGDQPFLAKPDLNLTTISLKLALENQANFDGVPKFKSAAMETVLFGRRVNYIGGKVEYKKVHNTDTIPSIVVTFEPNLAPIMPNDSGIVLNPIKVVWPVTGNPRLELGGELRLLADAGADGKGKPTKLEVVWLRLGGSLWWLNLEIPKESYTLSFDHQRGVVDIGASWSDGNSAQPIAGMLAKKPDIQATLVIATSQEAKNEASFLFTAKSGFGALNLISTEGPIHRFDQVLVTMSAEGKDPYWTSQIDVDLVLNEYQSRIHWPINSLDESEISLHLKNLASNMSGRVLKGKITAYDKATALRHSITMNVIGQAIPIGLLEVSNEAKPPRRRIALAKPWGFTALVLHKVASAQGELNWMTLDHVIAVDSRQLLKDAKDAIAIPKNFSKSDFAFAARYKKTEPDMNSASVIKGGLVLRAFAQAGFPIEALARHLVSDMFDGDKLKEDAVGNGIVITGAGTTAITTSTSPEGPFWPDNSVGTSYYAGQDPQGVLLTMPWLTAVDRDYDFGPPQPAGGTMPPKKLAQFRQATELRSHDEWEAPDIDWAAGSPMPLSRRDAPTESVGTGTAREIEELLERVRQGGKELPPLVPVEQLFLRSSSPVEITQQPLWLRSLLALRSVWLVRNTIDSSKVTMLVPVAEGRVARFRLAARTNPDRSELLIIGLADHLIAIDRSTTRTELLQTTTDYTGIKQAQNRARLVARAERLVKEPVAIIAVASSRESRDNAENIWTRINVPADLDDSILDLPATLQDNNRLYASPALGWPTQQGTSLSASGALGLGGDFPFQDLPDEAPNSQDVKTFGSGLSGRTASLSLPARAENKSMRAGSGKGPFIDVRSPFFVGLGRKMIFDRPGPNDLPIVAPPARHLSPTEARVVVPVADELKTALSRVVQGEAAPIIPPHIERTSLGLRPGAMQAEFDMLLFTDGLDETKLAEEAMDDKFPRFGRPGHAGPRLLRQHRPPRAPALPRVPKEFVKSHGRRTYVEIDELDQEQTVKPFLLMEGVGTVLRHMKPSPEEKPESFRIRVLGDLIPDEDNDKKQKIRQLPLQPEWTGKLVLHFSSASFSDTNELACALAKLGALSAQATASLSIDGMILPFSNASWDSVEGDDKGILLKLLDADITGVRAQLDAVQGDSKVFLSFRCAPEDQKAAPPTSKQPYNITAGNSGGLAPEPQRHFTLRLPVRPSARPSLPVTQSTLIFADPSYDRELSGPGAMDTQRDTNGLQWKLALDRFEYGTDTPVYFAFGQIDSSSGKFVTSDGYNHTVSFQRQPAQNGNRDLKRQDLIIDGLLGYDLRLMSVDKVDDILNEGHNLVIVALVDTDLHIRIFDADRKRVVDKAENKLVAGETLTTLKKRLSPFPDESKLSDQQKQEIIHNAISLAGYPIELGKAYAVTFDRFRLADGGTVAFAEGDQIVISVSGGDVPVSLSTSAKIVKRPVIAPPPAVYSLSVLYGDSAASVALHWTAPLPQSIEFPNLENDLAVGHIRRAALFVWTTSSLSVSGVKKSTLVKFDRAGGGQVPERASDLQA